MVDPYHSFDELDEETSGPVGEEGESEVSYSYHFSHLIMARVDGAIF